MLYDKKIEDITIEDINSLIENSVCENKFMDYKRDLDINTDSEKKEFLADVSSFANSTGGDLILGIEEDSSDKIPTKILGIPYDNDDKLIRKLEDLIRQSIQPIILNIEFRTIDIGEKKCILIIRIPQSLIAPHRVEFKGHNKFYTRNNKGKYQMDVNELRIAFNSGLDLENRIEEYKMDRYYELISNRYEKLKEDLPIFVIHYIPIFAMNGTNSHILSFSQIKDTMNNCSSKALGYGTSKNITIDGITIEYKDEYISSLAKYKNNGIIEKASTAFFMKQREMGGRKIDCINGYQIVNKLLDDINEVKKYYEMTGITTPIIISCSILNAANYTIPDSGFYQILNKIDKDILCINNIYLDDFNKNNEEILKPIFDSIWNACGYERCLAYDENGNYIGLK